jgi:signal transduction histidine kinase
MNRLGIRLRLAAAVTLVFTAAMVAGSYLVLGVVERRLVDDAHTTARTVLDSYLRDVDDGEGVAVVATIAPSVSARYFYLDADGREISAAEYLDSMEMVPEGDQRLRAPAGEDPVLSGGGSAPDTGSASGADQGLRSIAVNADRIGEVTDLDRGDGTVAVTQQLRLENGTIVTIGSSVPLAPIRESLDTLRGVLWVAVPVLALVVGVLTHITVGRALRPVRSITRRSRDITDRNLGDRVPVPVARDDVADLAVTMNEMLARLERSQARQRRFLADASHELRSPVAASRAQLEVALTHPTLSDWPTVADNVLVEQVHLGHLVADLMALSRLEEQGNGPTEPVAVATLVHAEAQRHRSIPVRLHLDADPVVIANRRHLGRALRNLVDNAEHHARTAIDVTVSAGPGWVGIDVDDDGAGVPGTDRERIFDRFARLDEDRSRHHDGVGLGLAIVEQVVRDHGGTVVCADAPTGGARLSIRLPAADQPSGSVDKPSAVLCDRPFVAEAIGRGDDLEPRL